MPALRVIRAETRLTVYCSLPYQNSRKKKEQAASHADTFDHDKHVLNEIASRKCLGISIISLSYASRLRIWIVRAYNDRAISEFYLHEVFPRG